MKKILLLIATAMLVGIAANAQQAKMSVKNDKKFLLSIAGGPSFPVAAFASNDTANADAGFAKTGFNVNLQFGYQLNDNFSITSTMLYSKNMLNLAQFSHMGVSSDHWQYYGMMIGPMLTLPLGEKAKLDLKTLAGVTRINSPNVFVEGSTYVGELWSNAFTMQIGTDLRYNISDNIYLITNLDYNFMKPKFNVTFQDGEGYDEYYTHELQQKMSVLNLSFGVGVNF